MCTRLELILCVGGVQGILGPLHEVLVCFPVASPKVSHIPIVQVKRLRAMQRRGCASGSKRLGSSSNGQRFVSQQSFVFVQGTVSRLKTGEKSSRAASTVATPGSENFHAATGVKHQTKHIASSVIVSFFPPILSLSICSLLPATRGICAHQSRPLPFVSEVPLGALDARCQAGPHAAPLLGTCQNGWTLSDLAAQGRFATLPPLPGHLQALHKFSYLPVLRMSL